MFSLRGNETRLAVFFLAATALFRLWFATTLDLVPDEAYYWLWSKHLDASYFSKGPAIAWTIALGTRLGGDTVLGIRLFSVLVGAGTGWQLFLLGRRLFDARTALYAVLLTAIVPAFAVGSILMTIDPLSVFFWVWAANLFLDALEKNGAWRWALCGFAVGSGFLAKFVNLLELLGFLGYALAVPRHRGAVFSWRGALLLAVAALCTVPVFWWNQHHGWITTAHLKHRGDLDTGFHFRPGQLLKFFQEQAILVLSPLLFVAALAAVGALLFRKAKSEAENYLLALFLPTFGFYFLLSFNEAAKGNWTVTSYPAAMIALAAVWPEWARRATGAKAFWIAALAVAALETAALHSSCLPFLAPDRDPILRLRGWTSLARQVEAIRAAHPADLILANNYGNASELTFYMKGRPVTYLPRTDHPENQFSFWPGYDPAGRSALFVTNDPDSPLPDSLARDFAHVEKVASFWREYEGKKIDDYAVWRLSN